jgi:predicted nucleotidyltransferase component of viral defense system
MATLIQMLASTLADRDPLLTNETRRIILKQSLQALVLDYFYNHDPYRQLRFYGGTCLHVLYGLNRLSEDLDLDNSLKIDLARLDEDLLQVFQGEWSYQDVSVKRQESAQGILRLTLKFPLLREVGLSSTPGEALHLKLEITHHPQVAETRRTPVFYHGRSFVPVHFSLETMMAGKIIAGLERSFEKGRSGVMSKGRDYYDLLWFMQQRTWPLEEKLGKDGQRSYTVRSAMQSLGERVHLIRPADLAVDLLPLFEQRTFIERWIEAFHENFEAQLAYYL